MRDSKLFFLGERCSDLFAQVCLNTKSSTKYDFQNWISGSVKRIKVCRILMIFGLLVFVASIDLPKAFAAKGKIEVGGDLMSQLERLLDTSIDLHTELIKKNSDLIDVQTAKILREIELAFKLSSQAGSNRPHFIKILERVQVSLDRYRTDRDEKLRTENLKDALSQLVHIAQSYKLTKSYRIYFCPRDKAVWLQVAGAPKNPVSPQNQNCGTVVKY